MKDKAGVVLYVGKAKKLRQRISQYFTAGNDGRAMVPYLTKKVAEIDFIVVPSEKEALLLENTLIKKHYPQYNALLRDDKTFICIKINHKHKWPRLQIVRSKEKFGKDALYFGPYPNALAARKTLELLSSLFPLRQCSDKELTSRKRPCILHSIGRCIAPCVNKCTKSEYDELVKQVVELLKGQDSTVIDKLEEQMQNASDKLEFEKAAQLHEKIKRLSYLQKNRKALVHSKIRDCDVFATHQSEGLALIVKLIFRSGRLTGSFHYFFKQCPSSNVELMESFLMQHYMHLSTKPGLALLPFSIGDVGAVLDVQFSVPKVGEKKKLLEMARKNAEALFKQKKLDIRSNERLLERMQETLELTRYPMHIECFDTSSSSAKDFVAAQVTFIDGAYEKKYKRVYKIRDKSIQGDVPALEEVLERRIERAKKEGVFPDLLIIDGGKGQLNAALSILKKLGVASIDCISIAKEDAMHTRGMTEEQIFVPGKKEPLILERSDSLLQLLQRIRDEVHRAAISYFRKRETKRVIKSALDDLTGIGPAKKKALLQRFKSIAGIKNASDDEILAVKGITKANLKELRGRL